MKKKLLVALISAAMVVTSIMPASAAVIENQGETNVNDTATIDTDTTEWSDSVKKTYMEVFSHGNLCQSKVLKYLKGYRKAW